MNISQSLIKVILSDAMKTIDAQVNTTGKLGRDLSRAVIRMALLYEKHYGEPLRHATAHELVKWSESIGGDALYCPSNVLTDLAGETALREAVEDVRVRISKHRKYGTV